MKSLEEIRESGRIIIQSTSGDGGCGVFPGLDTRKPNNVAAVIWSNGGGWDHVSVSFCNRCPTWEEMCRVKDVFFRKDECCIEYHPVEREYVNNFPYCLHIWKPQNEDIPTPASWMVGARKGETWREAMSEADTVLDAEETIRTLSSMIETSLSGNNHTIIMYTGMAENIIRIIEQLIKKS